MRGGIVLGCSAGGLAALQKLLAGLSGALPVPLLIASHSGSEDMATFCMLLQRHTVMPVLEAEERTLPLPGHVHVAPAGYHLLLERDGSFALNVDPRILFSRPSIDVLFETAAEAWGADALAIVLTGANADGAAGAAAIRAAGGRLLVQDPDDAEVGTMPAAALQRAGGADAVLPLQEIPHYLERPCLF